MIEEIKKEIELYIIKNHKDRYDELVDDIWEILDKYKKQQEFKWKCDVCGTGFNNFHAQGFDNKIYCPLCYFKHELNQYKTAWGKLKNMFINHIDAKAMNYQDNKLNPNEILNKMQELEQKYNLGGE